MTASGVSNRLAISHIRIGFHGVVIDANYVDSHRALKPFAMSWGRGLLIHGVNGLDAVTCPYGDSHSRLKQELLEGETTAGSFYYGYVRATRTLYLEYGADCMFNFLDEGVLPVIMYALKVCAGPLRGYVLIKDHPSGSPGAPAEKTDGKR